MSQQLKRLAQGVYRWRKTTVASAAGSYFLYHQYKDLRILKAYEDPTDPKKLVLNIPFDRLELVQKYNTSPLRSFAKEVQNLDSDEDDDDSNKRVKISVRDMVQLIHTAAMDKNITALYGTFGTGLDSNSSSTGERSWASWEEVRNALIVFSQSHRRHFQPNTAHQQVVIPRVEPKPLYCFADSFGSHTNPGNPQYYLASVFNKIHLQSNGELQLFGMLSTSFFLKGFLEKYGIQLHVFKHGEYKTAPNMWTEKQFTKAHKESSTNIVAELDADIAMDITASRSKALLTSWLLKSGAKNGSSTFSILNDQKVLQLWQRIHESGTFPAHTAWKAGLVDCLARRNPLRDLVLYNQALEVGKEEEANAIKSKWQPHETDFSSFTATNSVSLEEYRSNQAKMERIRSKRETLRETWQEWLGEDWLPSLLRGNENEPKIPKAKRERVACLDVIGAIDDSKAREVVAKLRSLKSKILKERIQDKPLTKCLVLRIVSPGGHIFACEQISQELRSLDIPTVVSFGDVAASGGYYIAAHAHRIFGSNKTVTGSIGVFGIRPDFTGLANKYGIQVDHVAAGNLAATYSVFSPMTRAMQYNMAHSVDKWYEQFKDVVQEGRKLDNVEELAQGKVWTGRQAKEVGLLDEIGGYARAAAYAKRTFCDDPDQAEMAKLGEVSFWTTLKGLIFNDEELEFQNAYHFIFGTGRNVQQPQEEDVLHLAGDFGKWLLKSRAVTPGTLSGILMTSDENSAIEILLRECQNNRK